MSGTVGVLSGDLARYSDFVVALMKQQLPPNAKLIWTKGADIVTNMNQMCDGMLEMPPGEGGDWLWILGDDHVFDGDILERLLGHRKDVVVPLCLKRVPPYDPVVYSHQNEDGFFVGYHDLPEHGLAPIHAAGSAGMLVSRRVLEDVGAPYFERGSTRGLSEDLDFCRKVRDAGYRIWCDVDTVIGHLSTVSVWPVFKNGEWQIGLHLGEGEFLTFPRVVQLEPVPA